jgi:hypothetical protein
MVGREPHAHQLKGIGLYGEDLSRLVRRSLGVAFSEHEPSTSYWATFNGSIRDSSSYRISLPLMLTQVGESQTMQSLRRGPNAPRLPSQTTAASKAWR